MSTRYELTFSSVPGRSNFASFLFKNQYVLILPSSYLARSFDQNNEYFHMIFLLPTRWTLLSLSYFT